MANRPGAKRIRVDSDGVRVSEPDGVRKRVIALCGVVVLSSLAVVMGLRWLLDANAEAADDDVPKWVVREPATPAVASMPEGWHAVSRSDPGRTPPPEREPAADDGGPPTHQEPDFTLDPSGERTGIALFPPAGTKPIQRGVLVPDDFELPPGYVRHFQATDDGQRVPAILKFHPDFEWLDENGQPVPLPADGVVPPELAPSGLPIRMLEPPDENHGADDAP